MAEHTVDNELVCTPLKLMRIPHFKKLEVICLHDDSDNTQKLFMLLQKETGGLRMVELDRDVSIPQIDNTCLINNWYFDTDTSRLILQYVDEDSKEKSVKVLPLLDIKRNS